MEKQSIIIVSKLCFDMRKHQHPKSYSQKILSSYCNLFIEHCTIDFAIIYTTIWLFLWVMALFYRYGSFWLLWLFLIVMALFDHDGSFWSLWLFIIALALFVCCGSFFTKRFCFNLMALFDRHGSFWWQCSHYCNWNLLTEHYYKT